MIAPHNTKMLISMPNSLADDISEFAKELKQNKSALVTQALEFYFDHLDLSIAKKRSQAKEETISFDELKTLSNESI